MRLLASRPHGHSPLASFYQDAYTLGLMARVRLTKIYTKTGDKGQTGLTGGQRVPKDDLRIECYGTVDELSSCVGIARGLMGLRSGSDALRVEVEPLLKKIQNELFVVGGDLATLVADRHPKMALIGQDEITVLEKAMDRWNKQMPALADFILPGGGQIASFLHLARTVCRRAERLCVALARASEINPSIVPYLNRLSDALFVLARWVSRKTNEPEFIWER